MANQWWYRDFPETAPSGPLTPEQMSALGRKGLIEPETEVSPDGMRWVRASQVKGLIPPNPPPAAESVAPDTEMRAIVVTEPIVAVSQPANSSREPWYYGFLAGYAGLLMFLACLSIVWAGSHSQLSRSAASPRG
jgi:hypothetical protein